MNGEILVQTAFTFYGEFLVCKTSLFSSPKNFPFTYNRGNKEKLGGKGGFKVKQRETEGNRRKEEEIWENKARKMKII